MLQGSDIPHVGGDAMGVGVCVCVCEYLLRSKGEGAQGKKHSRMGDQGQKQYLECKYKK